MSVGRKTSKKHIPFLRGPTHVSINADTKKHSSVWCIYCFLALHLALKKCANCRLCTSDVYPCWISNKNLFKPRMTKTVITSSNRQFPLTDPMVSQCHAWFSRKQVKIGIFAAKTLFHSSTLETKTTFFFTPCWLAVFWGGKKWCIKFLMFFFEEPVCLIVLELNLLNPIVTPKFTKAGINSWIPRKIKPNRQSTVE